MLPCPRIGTCVAQRSVFRGAGSISPSSSVVNASYGLPTYSQGTALFPSDLPMLGERSKNLAIYTLDYVGAISSLFISMLENRETGKFDNRHSAHGMISVFCKMLSRKSTHSDQ